MPAPVAVYVVAAIASFAAVYAFHEFVYEPHIAPAIERWAEDFLENRRARRRVPVASTRGPGDGDLGPRGADPKERTAAREQDSIELEGLNLGPVDEWRNEVHRTAPGTGARRRVRVIPDTDEGSMSTTIDNSFTSLTYTPLAPTHVISNVSSPFTETLSISTRTPTRAVSRASSNTASDSEREGNTTIIFAPSSNSSSPPPSPPFGPILPDTPRTSAAYSARPFSPVVRTPARSRAQSSRSSLRHSNSSSRVSVDVHGRRVDVDVEDEHVDINIFSDASASMHMSANISVVESLSERYPAAPTPPVLLSPPSSHTLLSSPNTDVLSLGSSGSRSGSPFAVLSPPEQRASLSGAASSLSPSMTSEDEFMSFDEGSDGVGERIVSRSGSARSPNPFSDSDEGSDFDSGSEGSWGRVSTGRR